MSNQNISDEYLKIHRHTKNVLTLLQILATLAFCAVLHPVFRNRLLLGSTANMLASTLPFSCGLLVFSGIFSSFSTRTKSLKFMVISSGLCLLGLFIVLGLTFGVFKSISSPSDEQFQKEFLSVLDTKPEKAIKTLHKYQQASQCCGVPLSKEIIWNQTSISPENPWASWYYYTILDEDYIDEARRLFTLPWSCCSDRTLACEHLAFERVSIAPSSKDAITDELVVVEHHLRTSRRSEDPRQSVYETSCEPPQRVLLGGVPVQLMIVGAAIAFLTLSAIGLDGFLIWKLYKEQKGEDSENLKS